MLAIQGVINEQSILRQNLNIITTTFKLFNNLIETNKAISKVLKNG